MLDKIILGSQVY